MAIRVRPCEKFSAGELDPKVVHIMTSITPISTVEEFEEACRENRGFQLAEGGRLGWHILASAAGKGNFRVVKHILEQIGKSTLNMGNREGVTPLFAACYFARSSPPEIDPQIYRTVEVLLRHNADVNLATTRFVGKGDIDGGCTPLWAAVKARDIALAQLLLAHGAELGKCPLTIEDKQSLDQARAGLADYRRGIHAALDPHLPPVLARIAVDYVGAPPYEAGPE